MKSFHPIAAFLFLLLCTGVVFPDNPEPAEIISRHLNSIAAAEKRQALKTLFAVGASEFESKNPSAKGGGKAIVVSDAENLYFLMSLNSRDYPFEKIGMFGDKLSIPFVTAGRRSVLGSFLMDNSSVLSENLFTGSMSLRWMNHIADSTGVRMKSAKMKKINGRDTYPVDVFFGATNSGNFKIRLYFDSETFRHVRSEYHREVDIGGITFRQQNQLQNAVVDLTEDYSEFRAVDGFTLPYVYKATLVSNSTAQNYESTWTIRVSEYYLNQKLAPDFFTFDVK
jgi:hypothetical protein